MITDLTGKVSAMGGAMNVTILAEIEADVRLTLAAGSRLVMIQLRSGDEYSVAGPAQVQFGHDGLLGLSGVKPVKAASPLAKRGRDIRIMPGAVTQAGHIMRSGGTGNRIDLLTLTGTKTLETAPEFRWQSPTPESIHHFELTDDAGKTLVEREVEGAKLKLSEIRLRDGAAYTWEVSAKHQSGRVLRGVGDFRVVTADLRERVLSLQPVPGAPVSARVAFATWLAQEGLRDEARKYWRMLATERPGDVRLKALAQQ